MADTSTNEGLDTHSTARLDANNFPDDKTSHLLPDGSLGHGPLDESFSDAFPDNSQSHGLLDQGLSDVFLGDSISHGLLDQTLHHIFEPYKDFADQLALPSAENPFPYSSCMQVDWDEGVFSETKPQGTAEYELDGSIATNDSIVANNSLPSTYPSSEFSDLVHVSTPASDSQASDERQSVLVSPPDGQAKLEPTSTSEPASPTLSNAASEPDNAKYKRKESSELDGELLPGKMKGMAGLFRKRFVKPQAIKCEPDDPLHRCVQDEISGNLSYESQSLDVRTYNQAKNIRRMIQKIQSRISTVPNSFAKGTEYYDHHADPTYPTSLRMEYDYKERIRYAILDWSDYHEQKPARKRSKTEYAPSIEEKQRQVLGRPLSNLAVQISCWDLVAASKLSQRGMTGVYYWSGSEGV
ncbi:hypothetical protein VHEMI00802 [[Torrubiella] hemipterigena]|uniref:Uncharacterized protein n=1 Tax=[Torrubiella] hemipterigena TaxID=1531966 RepID=A0A0A1SKB2_9HYPO|nr:hypothetical protein VHEMI00802 [[Torrubiella] hemipterigena]